MDIQEIGKKFKRIFCDQLCDGVDLIKEDVIPEAAFVNDLGVDSLDALEMIMSIEKEFNIWISDDEVSQIVTVADLLECIGNKIEGKEIIPSDNVVKRKEVVCLGFAVN